MFKILDVIFPTFCLGCGREGPYICKDCEIFLTEIESSSFSVLGLWEHEGLKVLQNQGVKKVWSFALSKKT